MKELLNLPGPWFIAAYLALGVVALMSRPLFRQLCRAVGAADSSGAPASRMTVHEEACLAAGARRACEVAATTLALRHCVQAAPDGRSLQAVGERPTGANELERAVFDSIRKDGTLVPVSAAGQAALQRCTDSLSARGLLHAAGSPRMRCQRIAAGLPLFALAAVGVAKIAIGLQRDRPVGILVALVIVTLAILWFSKGPATARTKLGDKTLEVLHKRNAALKTTLLRRADHVAEADVALAVALFGLSVLAGGPLDWLAVAAAPPPSDSGSSSGDSSSDSSSSSSSCSSGSSCGGGSGCGGCGS